MEQDPASRQDLVILLIKEDVMVTIRLARGGAKKRPFYQVVVADSRNARDGRFIERVGFFNPLAPLAQGRTELLRLNADRIEHWLRKGATVSARVSGMAISETLKVKDLVRNVLISGKKEKEAKESVDPANLLEKADRETADAVIDVAIKAANKAKNAAKKAANNESIAKNAAAEANATTAKKAAEKAANTADVAKKAAEKAASVAKKAVEKATEKMSAPAKKAAEKTEKLSLEAANAATKAVDAAMKAADAAKKAA